MNLKKITELIRAQQFRSAHCFYCLEHGVVKPPSHFHFRSWNEEEVQAIQERSASYPNLEELAALRGMQDGDSAAEDLCCQPIQSTQGSSLSDDGDDGEVDANATLEAQSRDEANAEAPTDNDLENDGV